MITYCIITAFLNAVSGFVLGLAVLIKDPRRTENRTLAWFTVSFVAWSWFYLMWQLSATEADALLYAKLLAGASIFIPVTYFHFVSRLAGRDDHVEILLGYLAAIGIGIISFSPWLVRAVEPAMMFPFWPKAGPMFWVYISVFLYFVVRAWMHLYTAYRSSTHLRHKQLGYVYFSTVIGWVGGLTNFLLWLDIPVPPVGNGLAVIYVVGVGYAMLRFRLADMSLFLVKGGVYVLIVASCALFFSVVSRSLMAAAPDRFPELAEVAYYIGAFLATSVVIVVLPWIKRRVDLLLEEHLAGEERQGLREHIRRIAVIRDIDEMFTETVRAVSLALDVPRVAVYSRDELSVDYPLKSAVGFVGPDAPPVHLVEKDPVVIMVKRNGRALVFYELEAAGEESARKIAGSQASQGIEVVVPIFADNMFFGVLLCGPRMGDQLYSDEAISLLEALCIQIGLTIRSRQIERQANQTEKLISLGTLAAGLAHELRNPLVSIRTFSSLIEEQGGDAEFRREFRGVVERDVNRIGSIIDHVAAFAENSQVKFIPVQLAEVISGVYDIARPEFTRAKVKLEVASADMPPVLANYGQLVQVFLNLFQNAIQAMEGQTEPCIRVSFQLVMPDQKKWAVLVTIRDNGPGIDATVRARIFDPFVTTKSTGEAGERRGMGLGLAIVKRIVDGHGGSIDVASQPGRGTSFFVQLPCVKFSK